MFKIKKPIVFFDTETTGVDVSNDRIIEIAMIKISSLDENGEQTGRPEGGRLNPEMHIPENASAVHGITDEDVKNSPTFKEKSREIFDFIKGCDLAGFNIIKFDVPLLFNEFARAGINWDYSQVNMIDAFTIYKRHEKRDLESAVRFYLDRNHDGAHGAWADTSATCDIFFAQLQKYDDLPETAEELFLYSNFDKKMIDLSGKFTFNENNEIIFNFGKHEGKLAKAEKGYLKWMLTSDFPEDVKLIAHKLIEGVL